MSEQEAPVFKQVYNKGYTKYGFAEKVYHLHVRYFGDWEELYFRDYLREHADVSKAYESLKRELKEKFQYNRDAYTIAKTEFIQRYMQKAKRLYGNRYKLLDR